MASPGNRHCANCIGTLSFSVLKNAINFVFVRKRYLFGVLASIHKFILV